MLVSIFFAGAKLPILSHTEFILTIKISHAVPILNKFFPAYPELALAGVNY